MNKYVYWVTFIAVNGGLLFGLNMAGISGAVDSIQDIFRLTDSSLGMVVSSLTLGCLVGALSAGSLADKYGRKKILIIISILFAISSIGCAMASSSVLLIGARVLAGLGVGAVSVVGPMYISEIAPAKNRGMLVSYNQFAIVIGILLAYTVDFVFINQPEGWRYMLGFPLIFSILFLVLLMLSFPESPRWLVIAGRQEEAKNILQKLRSTTIDTELASIVNSVNSDKNKEKVSFTEIFRGKVGRVLLLGSLLAAFQQITGINAVVNYAPIIFKQTGVGGDTAMLQSMLVGLINFLATIVALWLVDKSGRKTLLLYGAAGMSLSLAVLTYLFASNGSSIGILISLLFYIACFAASFAPVMWVVTSEIYPNRIRGMAMSFSSAIAWLCTFLTVQFSPFILKEYGGALLFGIFCIASILAFLFILFYIPETKGKSLEEIENELGLSD